MITIQIVTNSFKSIFGVLPRLCLTYASHLHGTPCSLPQSAASTYNLPESYADCCRHSISFFSQERTVAFLPDLSAVVTACLAQVRVEVGPCPCQAGLGLSDGFPRIGNRRCKCDGTSRPRRSRRHWRSWRSLWRRSCPTEPCIKRGRLARARQFGDSLRVPSRALISCLALARLEPERLGPRACRLQGIPEARSAQFSRSCASPRRARFAPFARHSG
jgi:hypothetical protein